MYINVGMANCEKRPKQERDDIRFTHIAIPTSFYPSPTHGPTQYPLHACRLPIHLSSSMQSTKFHITVSITQQLHHMHKYNNSKSLFSHNCNGSIITKQQSKITKTMLQPNNQLQHQSRTCHYPTHPDHHMQPPAPFKPIST